MGKQIDWNNIIVGCGQVLCIRSPSEVLCLRCENVLVIRVGEGLLSYFFQASSWFSSTIRLVSFGLMAQTMNAWK